MDEKGKQSTKLNIAIIHPDLGIGGAERLIVDAASELSSHGHKVRVFTSHHDRTRCFEETLTDQVSVIIPLLKAKKSSKIVFYCHFPDLLLAQHTTFIRRIYRKPIDLIEEATTGTADLILVNSRFTASTFAKTFKRLDSRGIKPFVLYPAVNVEQFEKPCAYNLNFLSINRFERKKNIGLAISSLAMLRALEGDALLGQDLAKVSLTVVGGFDNRLRENVEYLEELKRLAESEGVSDQVNFITSCSTSQRNKLLSQCLCVIYTPKDEHFGIVPLEAMAAQKPVIACNSGGPVETIKDGSTGFLCEPIAEDFALAMAKLIKNPHMAEKMGEEAQLHVSESFSTKVFGQQLNQYVVDIVHGKSE